jgi:hypothetical protein
MTFAKRGDHGRVRVAEKVVAAARNDGSSWLHSREKGGRRRAAAAVMRDFQQVGATEPLQHLRFGFAFDVTRKQRGQTTGPQLQDH